MRYENRLVLLKLLMLLQYQRGMPDSLRRTVWGPHRVWGSQAIWLAKHGSSLCVCVKYEMQMRLLLAACSLIELHRKIENAWEVYADSQVYVVYIDYVLKLKPGHIFFLAKLCWRSVHMAYMPICSCLVKIGLHVFCFKQLEHLITWLLPTT